MPDKSIRQFAEDCSVSHTAVRRAIAELQQELNRSIGNSQGKGKPTLLSESDQALLAGKLFVPVDRTDEQPQSSLSRYEVDPGIHVHQPAALQLATPESIEQLNQTMTRVATALEGIRSNADLVGDAFVSLAGHQGKVLGTRIVAAKWGAVVQTVEEGDQAAAKKFGLVQQPNAS
jgi:uncharacterized protein YukE